LGLNVIVSSFNLLPVVMT